MNKVVLIGRLTKEPAMKYTQNGIAVAGFTLAVQREFANGNGDKETDFISCIAWRGTAEFVANYIKKGYQIAVSGSIQTRNYQAQDGTTKYVTEVVCDSVQNLTPLEKKEQPNEQPSVDDLPF